MRIAQIAPLTEAVPPKLYGGTERVISWLTEALVEAGHEVTLFASGDFKTNAKLESVWPRALRLDGISMRCERAAYVDARNRRTARGRFRPAALPSRLLPVFSIHAVADAVRDDDAWAPRPARAPSGLPNLLIGARRLDLPLAADTPARRVLGRNGASRRPGEAADADGDAARVPCFPRAHLA